MEEKQKKTTHEVEVQEQYVGKCEHCGKENTVPYREKIVPKFCGNCGKEVKYHLVDAVVEELIRKSDDEKMFKVLNTKIDEVYETEDIQEVNNRVKKMWILLGISKINQKMIYVLGHLDL